MFNYDIEDQLQKKLKVLTRKNKSLAMNFKKKLTEVIQHDLHTINTYKNLKSPLHEYKRIHLTKNYILIFKVNLEKRHILFIDISHRDKVYK